MRGSMESEYLYKPEEPEEVTVSEITLKPLNNEYVDEKHIMYDVYDNNTKIGNIDLSFHPEDKIAVIATTELEYSLRGKGIGKNMYKKAIDIAKEKGFRLRSSDFLSEAAVGVWKSLVQDGLAEEIDNKYYAK